MEVKKSPKADLEGKKSTWLLIGYVVVLAFMFVAFEWTQRDVKIDTSQAVADVVFEEEIIPITETPEQATPPPPEAPKAVSYTHLDVYKRQVANLVPRANAIWHRYREEFGSEVGGRKRVFPFIY